MEVQKINQKEYLKRYLSTKDIEKKKKKKKIKVGTKTVQIIDDDIDFKKLVPVDDEEISILNTTEDAPQIVGIIDERGPMDFSNKQRWKLIADDGTGDIQISKLEQFKRNTQENQNNNDIKNKKQSISKNNRTIKKKSKHKSYINKNTTDSSDNNEFESENENKRNRRRKVKKMKDSTKKNRNSKKKTSTSSDSCSDSDSDSSSDKDSDLSISRSSKLERKISKKKKETNDSDLSPPRVRKIDKLSNQKRKNSDSDLSPPRMSKNETLSNRKGKNSDSDLSPSRMSKNETLSNRKEKNSDSDLSIPRNSKYKDSRQSNSDIHYSKQNVSYKKSYDRTKNVKSDSNFDSRYYKKDTQRSSHKKTYSSDSDLSPSRLNKRDKMLDRRKMNNSKKFENLKYNKFGINSEPNLKRSKRLNEIDSDHSTTRKHFKDSNQHYSNLSSRRYLSQEEVKRSKYTSQKPKVSRWDEESKIPNKEINEMEKKKIKKTLDGTSAGLQNLKSLKEEEEAQKKREAEMMKNLGKEVSGHGQTTVIRDRRTGRKRDFEKENAAKREKQKVQNEINEKYFKWGKGLKQMEDRQDQLKRDLHEMSKPLARYADDEDLDRELRARDREDDPMLAYIKEKEIKEGKRAPEKPKYEGTYIPNRFGIKPGYRWDGVDRSNGYEKKWFEARNTKKAIEDEAYKWSTADM